MGMTINEQIKALEYLKKCGIFPFSDTRAGIVITEDYVDGAIDTLHKYQKMQEVLDKVWHVPSFMLDEAECLNKIMETYRTVRW